MSDESLSALQEDIINRVKDVSDKGLTYTEDFLVYSHLWSDDRQVRNKYIRHSKTITQHYNRVMYYITALSICRSIWQHF